MRELTYAQAINEALHQIMKQDEGVILIGQGVNGPWYVGMTTKGLYDAFGERRVIDTPISEGAITGIGVGAAIAGLKPIVEHPRMDFMHLAMDQIANHAASLYFMSGFKTHVPVTLWGIINRGGSQGAQHSQALQAIFAHQPGLKVVMPSTPYDAKGLLSACVKCDSPTVFIDDRWLYQIEGDVPEELYEVPIGKGIIRRPGRDVTVVATSYFVHEALKAADSLLKEGIMIEVFDPLSIKPFDEELLFESLERTGRLVIADGGWRTCGVAAEIAAIVAEKAFGRLKSPVIRVPLPDLPAPASSALEKEYYPTHKDIARAARRCFEYKK